MSPATAKLGPPTLTAYAKTHVYILDACKAQTAGTRWQIASVHRQAQDNMRGIFGSFFDEEKTDIIPKIFAASASPQDILDDFEEEFRDKTEDDLVLMYFHGGSGNNGMGYSW